MSLTIKYFDFTSAWLSVHVLIFGREGYVGLFSPNEAVVSDTSIMPKSFAGHTEAAVMVARSS